MRPLRPQKFDIRAGECRELMATYSLHIQLRYALQYNGVELEKRISIRGWPGTYVPGYRHSAPDRGWGGEGISLPEG